MPRAMAPMTHGGTAGSPASSEARRTAVVIKLSDMALSVYGSVEEEVNAHEDQVEPRG